MKFLATAADPASGGWLAAPRANAKPSVGGSSFYLAMRVLPAAQRRAMFEIYRFCRAVDDIADGRGDRDARLAELTRWRHDVCELFAGRPPARVAALAQPVRAFDLQRDDFLSIIDGMEMDVRTDIHAPNLAFLDVYCDCVACAVGRLSICVFGMPGPKGKSLAAHLGRALQMTNILRDLDEDAGKGRLYLPREALTAAGIGDTDPGAVLDHPALDTACGAVADRAREDFAVARELIDGEPSRTVRAPRLMAQVYEDTLRQLVERGWVPPRRPVRVGRGRLLWIALRRGWLQ
jgi:presqualene diphosphate synthase